MRQQYTEIHCSHGPRFCPFLFTELFVPVKVPVNGLRSREMVGHIRQEEQDRTSHRNVDPTLMQENPTFPDAKKSKDQGRRRTAIQQGMQGGKQVQTHSLRQVNFDPSHQSHEKKDQCRDDPDCDLQLPGKRQVRPAFAVGFQLTHGCAPETVLLPASPFIIDCLTS